jgi:hypothetical protein
MTQGVLIFAFNNYEIDYIKIAAECARRVKLFLNKPVALVTDNVAWLESTIKNYKELFDIVIDVKNDNTYKFVLEQTSKNYRKFNDGALTSRKLEFKNLIRTKTFYLSPFDETLVIDCDYMIANSTLNYCWEQTFDFLIWKDSTDLAGHRDTSQFKKISDYTIDFYWATVFFFRKNSETEIFFNLVDHIRENWNYYKMIYQFSSAVYRNDHAFSIALHIMNGYQKSFWHRSLPGNMIYTIDSDLIIEMNDDKFTFLVEKEKYLGEYTLLSTKNLNVHVMNKFSLKRLLDE